MGLECQFPGTKEHAGGGFTAAAFGMALGRDGQGSAPSHNVTCEGTARRAAQRTPNPLAQDRPSASAPLLAWRYREVAVLDAPIEEPYNISKHYMIYAIFESIT